MLEIVKQVQVAILLCILAHSKAIKNNSRNVQGAKECSGTLMDLLNSSRDTNFTAGWVKTLGYTPVLDAQLANLTIFAPLDAEIKNRLPKYTGVEFDLNNLESIPASVALYNSLLGAYTEEQLAAAGSINTGLGLLKDYDIPLYFSKGSKGELLISDIVGSPENTARVVSIDWACNGVLYTLDRLLLPSNSSNQITNFYGDSVLVGKIFVESSNCGANILQEITLSGALSYVDTALESTGLLQRLSDSNTTVTLLLPFNTSTSAVSEPVLPVALYNMIPGAYCPSTLVSLKEVNSMLGAIQGEELPLAFSQGADGVLRVTGLDGTSVAVLDSIVVCKSVILVTDAALVPPQVDAASLSIPENLPTLPDRHLTCRPPVYNGTDTNGSSPSSQNSDEGNENKTSLIIGLSVGLGCAALIVAGIGWWWFRYHQRSALGRVAKKDGPEDCNSNSQKAMSNTGGRFTTPLIPLSAVVDSGASKMPKQLVTSSSHPSFAQIDEALGDWEIDPSDLTIDATIDNAPILLGRGSFGNVYKGMLREVQPVAVKVLPNAGAAAARAFRQEAEILRRVNRDRNIVQLYGVARLHDSFVLIMELMEGGDLLEAISGDTTGALHWHRAGKAIALDLARGLTALHACNVIHRDVKSKNVLLTAGGTGGAPCAKLADVGIAAIVTHGYITGNGVGVIGTLAWSAPEMLLAERCSSKVDIFSLGIVLWELATRQVPQRGFINIPEPSEQCPKELAMLISSCLDTDPSKRPTAKQVYEHILSIPPQEVV